MNVSNVLLHKLAIYLLEGKKGTLSFFTFSVLSISLWREDTK